ncbi:MAG: anaerobic ribonucleoside-triphosphate reductase activating protein [Candidatus Omnitrophica bacterium]|nr:anaerobic ribonucleoside-triphosphate reductase activating protein [Candidatus Omnitrophota bacterium]
MPIAAITPFTTIDFPGRLAAVFFTQGCAWRCAYCQNPLLWSFKAPDQTPLVPIDKIHAFLQKRRGLIDGIVICGGEPTAHAGLPDFLKHLREAGYQTALHTGGPSTEALKKALPFVDWVGMDIKSTPEKYERVTRVAGSADQVAESARIITQSGVAHEFRITVHPMLHSDEDLLAVSRWLKDLGARAFAIQRFRSAGCSDQRLLDAAAAAAGFPSEETLKTIRTLFADLIIRE